MDFNNKKTGKRISIIFVSIIITLIIILSIFTFISFEENDKKEDDVLKYTDEYKSIAPEVIESRVSSNDSIIVIDVRSCKCNYNGGHIPNATWTVNVKPYYNETKDILIYDNHEENYIGFCEQLVNNTYGEIYYLKGGIDAWKNAGYPIVK